MTRELTDSELQAFRARLIETATAMFAELGPDEVSLRGLAARLGVSRSTPYRYFRDLEAILQAVRSAALDRLAAACETAIAAQSDPLDQITAAGRGYLDFAIAEPNAFRILFDLRRAPPADDPAFRDAVERYGRITKAPIRAAIQAGKIEGDVDELARVLWCNVHGIAALRLAGTLPDDIPVDHVWQVSSRIAQRGISPQT